MTVLAILLSVALAGVACARPLESRDVTWGPCEDIVWETTIPFECGTLPVPLDYNAPENRTIDLQLLRVPATEQPSRGSIFFNFGGPGLESRLSLIQTAPVLIPSTGGVFDLVAIDPRGVANTITFNCSTSDLEIFSLADGFVFGNSSEVADAYNWEHSKVVASTCAKVEADTGDFVGSATVAKDMMRAVDVLEQDKMLRFWGLSYGSLLGTVAAALFPDRIDRIIIDGVQNVHEYYNSLGVFEQWFDSDKVFSGVWSTCIEAGPELCPLAASFDDATVLESAVWDLMESIKQHPITVGSNESLVVDYFSIRSFVAGSLYSTGTWPLLAAVVDKLIKGEIGDKLYELLPPVSFYRNPADSLKDGLTMLQNAAVQCGDQLARADSFEDIVPALKKLRETSRSMGAVGDARVHSCANWKFNAKDKYEGEWKNIKTGHPMLLIGNTHDGHTPLKSAHNVSATFEGSVVLEVNGYGHTSISLTSVCATKTTAEYFVNGTLPEKGKVCPVDLLPYHTPS